jgi:hypothetical protein
LEGRRSERDTHRRETKSAPSVYGVAGR